MSLFDVREQFPQLKRDIRGKRLVYLDSGATTLKPLSVIEAVRASMANETANVHRGAHYLSDEATGRFEIVREKARAFIGAQSRNEVIFTKGTTDGINLVAQTLGRTFLNEGDEIVLSQMEHHSNIVPWQIIAREKKAVVRFIKVKDDGSLDLEDFEQLMGSGRVKVVSLVHISNALGTINPLTAIFKMARAKGAYTVVDAAQSIAAMPLNVRELGCDFMAFSGHKMFGPTGVGILYGREDLLLKLPPYQGGGSMISEVTEQGVDFLPPPHRFEAGTPAIAEVMGMGAAFDFISAMGFAKVRAHEAALLSLADSELGAVEGIRRIGTAAERSHVLSFLLGKNHPSDVGAILDEQGIAVRSGHHCCQPLMRRFGVPGTVRATFSVYNSEEDVHDFVRSVKKAKELLG